MFKIWLDDKRPMPQDYDTSCTTIGRCVVLWLYHEDVLIDFDHDLGTGDDTGAVLASIIERLATLGIKPPAYKVHSSNTVGAKAIEAAMTRAAVLYNVTQIQNDAQTNIAK